MGYNDDGNDDMSSPPPRVDDNENFEFDDPPSFPPPLPPRIVYLVRREGLRRLLDIRKALVNFPKYELSAFSMPPSSSAVKYELEAS